MQVSMISNSRQKVANIKQITGNALHSGKANNISFGQAGSQIAVKAAMDIVGTAVQEGMQITQKELEARKLIEVISREINERTNQILALRELRISDLLSQSNQKKDISAALKQELNRGNPGLKDENARLKVQASLGDHKNEIRLLNKLISELQEKNPDMVNKFARLVASLENFLADVAKPRDLVQIKPNISAPWKFDRSVGNLLVDQVDIFPFHDSLSFSYLTRPTLGKKFSFEICQIPFVLPENSRQSSYLNELVAAVIKDLNIKLGICDAA